MHACEEFFVVTSLISQVLFGIDLYNFYDKVIVHAVKLV